MNRTYWRIALLLPWIAIGAVILEFWRSWGQFPARVASHFNYYGQADGWMSKGAFPFPLVVIPVLMLAFFTVLLSFRGKLGGGAWLLLVVEYWVTAILCFVTHGLVQFNLGHSDRLQMPFVTLSAIAVVTAAAGIAMHVSGLRRTVSAHDGGLLAVERHASGRMAAIMAALSVIPLAIAVLGTPAVRPGMFIGVAALLFTALFAWMGFEYRITTAGIEIRAFGFPLRYVAATEITQYGVETSGPMRFGGWGIRGIGCRAYFWGGKKVLHVRTALTDLYLGHSDPDRLVRELDDMKQLVR